MNLTSRTSKLNCSIYYDPTDDDCVLVNKSISGIRLTSLGPEGVRRYLEPGFIALITPGMWRISVEAKGEPEVHAIDFLVLRRQFAVGIREAADRKSAKRKAIDRHAASAKRQRQDVDATEIIFAPTAKPLQHVSTEVTAAASTSSQVAVPARHRHLLDLNEGDVAEIRSSHPSASGPSAYELCRLEQLAITPSASVFTVKHSALSDDVVAKVIRYEGKETDLVWRARNWEHEKKFLEKLNHVSITHPQPDLYHFPWIKCNLLFTRRLQPNIMSLKAFDGRLFAMYVEHLPRSLQHGDMCALGSRDARDIVRDMSSALAYLESQQVVHNDIKPGNIAYSPLRGAVLLDFELAGQSNDPVTSGGTQWYVPPEYRTHNTRGTAGDMWAFGVTILYVLRKTCLPEKKCISWRIRDVAVEQSVAHMRMMAWVNQVAQMKRELDRADMVEELVYTMLHEKPDLRVRAAHIVIAFETNQVHSASVKG